MGKRARACGGHDSRRHHVLRLSSLIGHRSAGRLGTHQTGEPRDNLRTWQLDFGREVLCKECIRLWMLIAGVLGMVTPCWNWRIMLEDRTCIMVT